MPLSTFILSELYSGSITYGLELQRRFETAGILSWGRVAHSSVYRALASLERKGLVARYQVAASVGPARGGGGTRGGLRRNRKLFAITRRGRRAFEAAVAVELAEPRTYRNPLNIAVHCLGVLSAPRALSFLEERRLRLAAIEADASATAGRAQRDGGASDQERLAAERILMKARAELFFAGSLADCIRSQCSDASLADCLGAGG